MIRHQGAVMVDEVVVQAASADRNDEKPGHRARGRQIGKFLPEPARRVDPAERGRNPQTHEDRQEVPLKQTRRPREDDREDERIDDEHPLDGPPPPRRNRRASDLQEHAEPDEFREVAAVRRDHLADVRDLFTMSSRPSKSCISALTPARSAEKTDDPLPVDREQHDQAHAEQHTKPLKPPAGRHQDQRHRQDQRGHAHILPRDGNRARRSQPRRAPRAWDARETVSSRERKGRAR